ncbi:hypothetical protein BV882_02535 [Streptomyces sp. 46]|nr:hypothetical protein BV882_02535 [Streptomyces sp. 46]
MRTEAGGFRAEADGFRAEADGFRAEADGFRAEADGFLGGVVARRADGCAWARWSSCRCNCRTVPAWWGRSRTGTGCG